MIRRFISWCRRPGVQLALLALVTAALLTGALLAPRFLFECEPPKSIQYGKIPAAAADLRFTVGTQRIAVRAVARNRAEGGVLWEDGRGKELSGTPFTAGLDGVTSCARWMDVANIYLGLDTKDPESDRLFSLNEIQIFDHATREALNEQRKGMGWAQTDRGVIQLYGIGWPLPDAVDMRLLVETHSSSAKLLRLEPRAGARAAHGDQFFKIREITRDTLPGMNDVRVRLEWSAWPEDNWELLAFDHRGYNIIGRANVFLKNTPPTPEVTLRNVAEDVAFFELHPLASTAWETFYFDGVRLPNSGTRHFTLPPPVRMRVDGTETSVTVRELAPLRVSIRAMRGLWEVASSEYAEAGRFSLGLHGPVGDPAKTCSFLISVAGVNMFRYFELAALQDRAGAPLPRVMSNTMGKMTMGGAHFTAQQFGLDLPLERIGEAEFRSLRAGEW